MFCCPDILSSHAILLFSLNTSYFGMHFIDTHAHLCDSAFRETLPSVLNRARQAGVRQIINVATTAQSSREAVEIAESTPGVFASVGIHPNYAHEAAEADWAKVCDLANNAQVVALGETGLDKYWDDCPWPVQVENFWRHINFSAETRLPLIIHARDCWDDIIAILRAAASQQELRGVMHSFTGSTEQAETLLSFGLHISFAGMLTYKKSLELRETASQIPYNRILVETDSPYLSPEPKRSHRPNESSLMIHTAAVLADCQKVDLGQIALWTTENARRLFPKITDSQLEATNV